MELLKIVLLVVLLTAAAAKPMPPDADIPDKDQSNERLDGNEKMSSITGAKDSEESSESTSEESNSSEEKVVTDQPTVDSTTATMTTFTSGDGSTMAPEPDTMNTNGPVVMNTTPSPGTIPDVTTPCNTTMCFTVGVPTPAPVTQIRGDM